MANRRVWLTRTAPAVAAESKLFADAGYQPVVRPVLQIQAIDARWPTGAFDLTFFLSTQAVRRCVANADLELSRLTQPGQVIAVGRTTQALLAEHGIESVAPAVETSEGIIELLATLKPAGLAGCRALVVAGAGGRGVLEAALAAEHCAVVKIDTYRRVPTPGLTITPEDIDAIVVASGDGFQVVRQLWCAADGQLNVPLVVPSARVADLAREFGFTRVAQSTSARPQTMVDCLSRMFE